MYLCPQGTPSDFASTLTFLTPQGNTMKGDVRLNYVTVSDINGALSLELPQMDEMKAEVSKVFLHYIHIPGVPS